MHDFQSKDYNDVYHAMLDLIDEVKGDPYHGQKFASNLQKWAQRGMYEAPTCQLLLFTDCLIGV